ncbi:MAG: hypothetical protein KDJ65_05265 [Anaerolineae bacterium]|nr:hypothetical protein [Anaerolineae bacterium]
MEKQWITSTLVAPALRSLAFCLGMMTYGTLDWRNWVLPKDQSHPFIKRALE